MKFVFACIMYFKGDYLMTSIMFISVDFIARDVFLSSGGFSAFPRIKI